MNSRRTVWVVAMLALTASIGGVWLLAQGPSAQLGALTVSPPNIVFNTPSVVTFVVRIASPTVNPTAVTVQQVNSGGTVVATVGTMNDKGKTGDAVGDDRNFTLRTTLNLPTVGKVYYRAQAAFRGNTPSALSPIVAVDVDPFTLPPDPGEAGKQTLEGIDSDNDGVRDDVQRLAGVSATTRSEYTALIQYSLAVQAIIVNSASSSVTRTNHVRAIECLGYLLGIEKATERIRQMSDVLVNTPSRDHALAVATTRSTTPFPRPAGRNPSAYCR